MSMNNTKINLYKNPNYIDLIPLGVFSVSKPELIIHPISADNTSNFQYNHSMDKIFIFKNKNYLESKSLYFNDDWNLNIDNENNISRDEYPILSIMTYPSSIYKVQTVTFENNQNINVVHDLYTFNLHNLTGIFKDCKKLTFYKAKKFGPSKCIDDRDLVLDYAFANCFSLLHPPYHDLNITFWEEVVAKNKPIYMNYMFMNTPNILYTHLFLRHPFIVSNNGGNGIFLNSALYNMPILILSNVTELRNTFSKTKLIGGGAVNYTTDLNSAIITDGMFKDSTAILNVITNSGSNIKITNGMFKDSSVTLHTNPNISLLECNAMYSGCESLISIPNIDLSECEYINDIFRGCIKLNKFYNIHPENAIVVSGVYENCENLRYLSKIVDSRDNRTLLLNKAEIINNLFKGCISLSHLHENEVYENPIINLQTTKDIYADSLFSGCSSLINRIQISSDSKIKSSACMFKDCTSLNESVSNFCSNSENTTGMYSGCVNLPSYYEDNSNSILSSGKFENCTNLSEGKFITNKSTHTANMFKNCIKMNNFDGGTTKCSNSKDVSSMFEGCTELRSTPTLFDSSSAEKLVNTFKGCNKLTTVNINLNNAKNADGMVNGCTALSTINLTVDSSTTFTKFPKLDFRGTNLSVNSFTDIVGKLPNMSSYTSNNTISSSNLTWTDVALNTLKDSVYYTESVAKCSNTFTLNPGEYTLTITGATNNAAYIEKIDNVNGNHIQMSPLVYSRGLTLEMNIQIDEKSLYRLITLSVTNTGIVDVKLNWVAPYFTLDIRNTPADDLSSASVVNGITTLNNKGWRVKYSENAALLSLFDEGVVDQEPIIDNYLINVPTLNEDVINLQTTDLDNDNLYEYATKFGNIYYTDYIEIPAGYYNLSNINNLYDKLTVYKLTETGEYPIAITNENEFSTNFEVFETSIICIKFRIKNNYGSKNAFFNNYNLVLKKL